MGRAYVVIWASHSALGPIGRHPMPSRLSMRAHYRALAHIPKVYPMSQSDGSPTTFATGNWAIGLPGPASPSPRRQLYHVRDKEK
jgi:hypothetical protein